MNFGRLFGRQVASNASKLKGKVFPSHPCGYRRLAATPVSTFQLFHSQRAYRASSTLNDPTTASFHKSLDVQKVVSDDLGEDDATMNEFLSRFVWVMRKKLSEVYPGSDKSTVDGMLLVIVGKVVEEMEKGDVEKMIEAGTQTPSQDLSEDLWRTVWDISNLVLRDMEKEKKKEKMKSFLQSEEVKEMYRFAGEVGVRGDMLRELRFKWAREKMEESEFYQSLELLRKEEEGQTKPQENNQLRQENVGEGDEGQETTVSLPKRHGKIKYKIYGLDLSDTKWAEIADKIQDNGEAMWSQEPKALSGKGKIVTDKILSLKENDDPAPLLAEWIELLQPNRIDWITLLDRLKDQNSPLYLKIAELVLDEESFEANIRDFSKLIDALARENRIEDAERILKKMNQIGILSDVITLTTLVHMYCKSGNLDRAKEAFDSLRANGFQLDIKLYNSMIMAYVEAGQPRLANSLMGEMEKRDIKPTREMYMAVLHSYAQRGDFRDADRISTTMQFANFQPTLESSTLMIEAYARAGEAERARTSFDQMMNLGQMPDDRCLASMISAYQKKNSLDEALNLLLELEKRDLLPGVATYTVLVDWLTKLELFEEAEQILDKISELGESPPLTLHVSLCDMYIKSGSEKKALQALGVLESNFKQLEPAEFERIIGSLKTGGFVQDATRILGLMETRGFPPSEHLKTSLMVSQTFGKRNTNNKSSLFRNT